MSDDTTDAVDDTTTDGSMDIQQTAVTSAYKVLGQLEDGSGVGVLGQNDAESGTPIGVQGAVPNASGGYGLYTGGDAFVGTRLETTYVDTAGSDYQLSTGTTATADAGNVVQGHASNSVSDGAEGVTIGGGGYDDGGTTVAPNIGYDDYGTIGGGENNQAGSNDGDRTTAMAATVGGGSGNNASAQYSTVAGGSGNDAEGEHSTVAGGDNNTASGDESTVGGGDLNDATAVYSTVAGGTDNEASGPASTVAGGISNTASGTNAIVAGGGTNEARGGGSFAAGGSAKANDDGAFVWADGGSDFASDQPGATGSSPTGPKTFHVRATGGIRLVTGLDGADDPNAGAYLGSGDSTWAAVSARSAKQHIDPVDPKAILDGVGDIEISTWEYTSNPGVRRMGPMAGDFHDAFELGNDPETIGHVDADGVALAAIQGLAERLEETRENLESKDARIEELEEQTERLPDLEATADHVEDLEAENDGLRDQLATLEDRVASLEGGPGDCGVTADD